MTCKNDLQKERHPLLPGACKNRASFCRTIAFRAVACRSTAACSFPLALFSAALFSLLVLAAWAVAPSAAARALPGQAGDRFEDVRSPEDCSVADLVPGDCWAAPAVADSVADYSVELQTADRCGPEAACSVLVDSQARLAADDWARDGC